MAHETGPEICLEILQDRSGPNRSWQVLSRGPSGDRIARSCRHTGPDLTVKTRGRKIGSQDDVVAICFGFLGPLQTVIVRSEIKQKQLQDRKPVFETLSLPVAKILSPVARQAPTKARIVFPKFVPRSVRNICHIFIFLFSLFLSEKKKLQPFFGYLLDKKIFGVNALISSKGYTMLLGWGNGA